MKKIAITAFAILLMGCGASDATPPAENPLLTNGVSITELYVWIDSASDQLDQNAAGYSRMCRHYEIARAKARKLPEQVRGKVMQQFGDDIQATCAVYLEKLAPQVARQSGLNVTPADLKTSEVWAKFNRGKVAHSVGVLPEDSDKGKDSDNPAVIHSLIPDDKEGE